jgi:adenine-specific DNA-methyltransferase
VPHHTLEINAKLSLAKKRSLDASLIIEGDKLIALKSLLPTHAGKIKCISIDPPYNTGNEGWIYNDNLTQSVRRFSLTPCFSRVIDEAGKLEPF